MNPRDHESDHPLDRTIPMLLARTAVAGDELDAPLLLDVPATVLWALGRATASGTGERLCPRGSTPVPQCSSAATRHPVEAQNAAVSPTLAMWPLGLRYTRTFPVTVSRTVRAYSTLDSAP